MDVRCLLKKTGLNSLDLKNSLIAIAVLFCFFKYKLPVKLLRSPEFVSST